MSVHFASMCFCPNANPHLRKKEQKRFGSHTARMNHFLILFFFLISHPTFESLGALIVFLSKRKPDARHLLIIPFKSNSFHRLIIPCIFSSINAQIFSKRSIFQAPQTIKLLKQNFSKSFNFMPLNRHMPFERHKCLSRGINAFACVWLNILMPFNWHMPY